VGGCCSRFEHLAKAQGSCGTGAYACKCACESAYACLHVFVRARDVLIVSKDIVTQTHTHTHTHTQTNTHTNAS
jgi:hypothetical protein